LILGLAPGAHGSNRTGRPFTGDGSGNFLYPVLYETGFASQPDAYSREDGMDLRDCWISSVVRCVPPGNKPEPVELANCSQFLDQEMALLTKLKVIVCLGRISFDGCLNHFIRMGILENKKGMSFFHGAEYPLPQGKFIIASFHPSLQNTNTGKLTAPMMRRVFVRVRELAGLPRAH
jgi:uracil-DNA glycosylase family 4